MSRKGSRHGLKPYLQIIQEGRLAKMKKLGQPVPVGSGLQRLFRKGELLPLAGIINGKRVDTFYKVDIINPETMMLVRAVESHPHCLERGRELTIKMVHFKVNTILTGQGGKPDRVLIAARSLTGRGEKIRKAGEHGKAKPGQRDVEPGHSGTEH